MNPSEPGSALPAGALARWWWQGLRSACLRRPDWHGLAMTPLLMVVLVLAPLLLGVLASRLQIDGAAEFSRHSLWVVGWAGLMALLLASWLACPSPASGDAGPAPSTAKLFALLCAQSIAPALLALLVLTPLARQGELVQRHGTAFGWLAAAGPAWMLLAQFKLLWQHCRVRTPARWALLLVCTFVVMEARIQLPPQHWIPAPPDAAAHDQAPPFQLTQAVFEAQAAALQRDLAALTAPETERPELFVITFAPNAEEGVFQRESDMVAAVMHQRFGTRPRTLQLMNLKQPDPPRGWATPQNLRRALHQIGRLMDPARDLLFIHLTSHGARNGALAPDFPPLQVDPITPQLLRAWLDEAGIRHRIVSVSACFSGSWIAPLASADTLVMTAADKDHTSYGCGKGSPLTYFGRAMYDEALRSGASLEAAHAKARTVIAQREREAGKDDGYSNPQILMGAALRERLATLEARGPD